MPISKASSRSLVAAALVIAMLALASCGDDDDEATTSGNAGATTAGDEAAGTRPNGNAPAPSGEAVRSERVEIVDFAYDPDPVTIQAGGKVTWINKDSAPHTATADDSSFDTGSLNQDKLKSESFKEPGEYPYHCEIHPSMHGTVEVVSNG